MMVGTYCMPYGTQGESDDMQLLKCAKCGGAMEKGFMLEVTHGGNVPPEWVAGKLERSFWTGVNTKGRTRHTVATYRCTACGYLESYTE